MWREAHSFTLTRHQSQVINIWGGKAQSHLMEELLKLGILLRESWLYLDMDMSHVNTLWDGLSTRLFWFLDKTAMAKNTSSKPNHQRSDSI